MWVYGAEGNTGQLYVTINGVKAPCETVDLANPAWQQCTVDLSTLGVDLSNITTLSIGIEGVGEGVVYIDDICLYARVF